MSEKRRGKRGDYKVKEENKILLKAYIKKVKNGDIKL